MTSMLKSTCHIEDENRNVLYESVSKKSSLLADSEMEFVDHILNRRTLHMVGKVFKSTNNHCGDYDIFENTFMSNNYSTFDFDGKEIWKQLQQNGIRIGTYLSFPIEYLIYRDDIEIAHAMKSSTNIHEKTDKQKGIRGIISKIPKRNFFCITTKEKNLDAIFLTLFAISRTNMAFYK